MKFIYSLLLFVVCGSAAEAQEAAELVQKVRAKLEKVKDYTAEGRLKMDVSFIDAPPSKVQVFYKKPDKFKVKSDGGISILPKGGVSINLGSLLAGQEFDVLSRKDTVIGGVTLKTVKLVPIEENSSIVQMTLNIDEKALLIKRAVIRPSDNSGTYEVDMSYGKYSDWGMPDKVVFSFDTKDYKLPKGITFEYEKGGKKKTKELKNKKGKIEITYSAYTINKGVDDKVFTGK